MNILDKIVADKRIEVQRHKEALNVVLLQKGGYIGMPMSKELYLIINEVEHLHLLY